MLTVSDVSQINQMIFVVFAVGVVTGAICTGFLGTVIRIIDMNFKSPRRIKTNEGYLYRLKNKYVRLEEKQQFHKDILLKHKGNAKGNIGMLLFGIFLFLVLIGDHLLKFSLSFFS
ncbi:hypothetical protein [Acinetobacter sp. SEK570]|uniref:hypothetical protein n=1 Tax=unclassified Acinetobacter TaxID=196816 RepID=UPI0039A15EA5